MTSTRMPVLFVGHGSPMAAIEHNEYSEGWAELGRRLPRPKAILAISAHWETKGILVTRAEHPRTIHDFYGFPPELYAQEYRSPGDPALAARIEALLAPYARADLDCWGYDHGTWSVLMHMYPEADIPVIQLSMDVRLSPRGHYQVGKALQALRDEGVLILGTGNIVHNLRLFKRPLDTPPAPFAERFNETVKAKIIAGDDDALVDYASLDPEVDLCFPEPEHFHPLLYVLGARDKDEPVEFVNDTVYSTISMTSVLIGAEKAVA